MNLWRKLSTLFKASAQEPLEGLVDANGIRIFEQEIRQAEQAMVCSKHELASVMAEKKQLQRQVKERAGDIETHEHYAIEALNKHDEELAAELAERIADDEALLKQQQQQLQYISEQEQQLNKQLKNTAKMIAHYQNELRLAKANQSAQSAIKQLRGSSGSLGTNLADMSESLQRIKSRQQHVSDVDSALQDIDALHSDQSLKTRLKARGIDTGEPNAESVLKRLKELERLNKKQVLA